LAEELVEISLKMTLKTINIEGQAYFVTSKVYKDKNLFVYQKFCQIIIENLRFYRKSKDFKLLAYIIMPNHLHIIIWPVGKYNISEILRDFKKQTSKEIIKILREGGIRNPTITSGRIKNPTFSDLLKLFTVNSKKQQYKVWQSRNWVENIYSDKFLEQKTNYIHNNPVRAKLVEKAEDYPYSSFKNYFFNGKFLINIDKI
jgi:putative transposase